MRVWECSPFVEAQSSGYVVGSLVPSLDDPQEDLVFPLEKRGGERMEEELPGKSAGVGGDVEAATGTLVMVEAHSGHDLAIHLAGDAVKVGHPDEPGTRMNPRMDLLLTDDQALSHSAAS